MQRERVTRPAVQPNDVIAELRQHWLRDLAWLDWVRGLLKIGDEPSLCTLTQIAALYRRTGVRRFALRDVLELGAARDLGAQLHGVLASRGTIGPRNDAWDIKDAQYGTSRPVELRLVRVVVLAEIAVRDVRVRGIGRGMKRDEADRGAVVGIPPGAPQVFIRDVDAARHLLEQLLLGHFAAIVRLERHEQAGLPRLRAGKETLILDRVEPAVGEQIGCVPDPGRRRIARIVTQLLVGHADAALLVLLLQQHLRDHVVERLVFQTPELVLCQRAAGLLLRMLNGLL